MKTFVQICKELGYTGYHTGYMKLRQNGVELSGLKRYVGKDSRVKLYDEETERYLKAVIGKKQRLDPKPVLDNVTKVATKDLTSQSIQTKKVAKAAAAKSGKTAKAKVSAQKVIPTTTVQEKTSVTVAQVSQSDINRRLQQLQALGELIVSQINQLTDELSGQKKVSASAKQAVAS